MDRSMVRLAPPCAYQGGKQRLAGQIADRLLATGARRFADLCCGSGAVSIELVNRGVAPDQIDMVDLGPWGGVWAAVGSGIFGLAAFRGHIDRIPTDPAQIQAHVQALSKQPADDQAIYAYLVLQAAAFGSKPIWVEGGRWQNCTFRGYWLPRPDTSRQSPVNPMMPMPETLYARMAALVTGMKGVRARQADVTTYEPEPETAVYIDPPYVNTTRYGHAFDVATLAKSLAGKGLPVFVS